MSALFFIILVSGTIMLARSALFWLYWIQTKHYRLDRIWLEIKQREFWRLFFSSHRWIVLVLLITWFTQIGELLYVRDRLLSPILIVQIVTAMYIFLYATLSIIAGVRRKLRLPRLTRKTLVLLIATLTIDGLLLIGARNPSVPLLLTELAQPIIVLGIFVLAYTPNIFLHRYFISRARRKIAVYTNLIVIGITGSYGKTTTKEFLAHILSKKYKVLKTPAHINVDTGVAKVILKSFSSPFEGEVRRGFGQSTPTPPSSHHPQPLLWQEGRSLSGRGGNPEVFIVEMGAYKRGEIKKICDLVRPQYAVLTGLSDQHLELFGSLETIADAKFELVESVGQSNKLFANEDSAELVLEFKRRAIMPTWYGIAGHAARFKVSDVKFNEDGTVFTLHGVHYNVPTIGTAALTNLLGAITVAVELGIHLDDLPAMLQDLPALSGTMRPQAGPNGALLIDDTYNANTEGVLTALADLVHFKRARKIFVFSQVIELGSRADEDHAKIAQAAAQFATHAFLLPSRRLHAVRSQLIERGYGAAQIIRSIDELKKLLDSDAVVLFEGRDAAKVLNQLAAKH